MAFRASLLAALCMTAAGCFVELHAGADFPVAGAPGAKVGSTIGVDLGFRYDDPATFRVAAGGGATASFPRGGPTLVDGLVTTGVDYTVHRPPDGGAFFPRVAFRAGAVGDVTNDSAGEPAHVAPVFRFALGGTGEWIHRSGAYLVGLDLTSTVAPHAPDTVLLVGPQARIGMDINGSYLGCLVLHAKSGSEACQ